MSSNLLYNLARQFMIYTNPKQAMKQMGERIKKARLKAGLTQEELGKRVGGKNVPTISHYEHGNHRISAIDLLDFSEALETPVIYFFQDNLQTRDEMETVLLHWFRRLPTERKPRVFQLLEYVEGLAPLIIGDMPSEPKTKKRKG